MMINKIKIETTVNNIEYSEKVEPRLLASDFIRENLNLTGTHVGCEHGVCGSCTIKINGITSRSCLKFAIQLDGKRVETVESFSSNPEKKIILNTFKKFHALQCGFCTPGFLITVDELLQTENLENEKEIRKALSGNLCRCTGYENIIKAVLELKRNKKKK
mgnify:FL=1